MKSGMGERSLQRLRKPCDGSAKWLKVAGGEHHLQAAVGQSCHHQRGAVFGHQAAHVARHVVEVI